MRFTQLNTILCLLVLFIVNAVQANSDDEELKPELKELLEIVESEKILYKRLDDDVSQEKLKTEIEMRVNSITEAYEAYVEKYSDSAFGKILYGKFLRKTNKPEKANDVFLEIHEDNPDIAVVNQQLALYASETGKVKDALKFFEKSLKLDPQAAIIYYQFGEYLYTYKIALLKNALMTVSEVEQRMNESFKRAHELDTENRDFKLRYAESFFDIYNPDWNITIPIWDSLISTSKNLFERDVLKMQKARVLIKLKKYYDARELLKPIRDPSLIKSKKELYKLIEENEQK